MTPKDAEGGGYARLLDMRAALGESLIGHERLIDRLLIALLASGHVLVEGAPGLAKTRAVKELAAALDVAFSRVQCTPDLMPADLTGAPVFRPDTGAFEFVSGPVFNNLVLVDEVNRAPPKVQSALLEAMAEGQVTSGGQTHPLPSPFVVVATQNPIENEGTYPLPEAQLDRFLCHIALDLPDRDVERRILDLVEAEAQGDQARPMTPLSHGEIAEVTQSAMAVHISPVLRDYIVRLVTATRDSARADEIAHGVSPRGSISLAATAKARAWLAGRDHALPEDVADLAEDVLAHRLILTWEARAEGKTPRGIIAGLVKEVEAL